MSDNNTVHVGNGSLLPTLLLVLFVGLKLANIITWPWIWVLSPLWIPVVLVGVLIVVAVVVGAVTERKSGPGDLVLV